MLKREPGLSERLECARLLEQPLDHRHSGFCVAFVPHLAKPLPALVGTSFEPFLLPFASEPDGTIENAISALRRAERWMIERTHFSDGLGVRRGSRQHQEGDLSHWMMIAICGAEGIPGRLPRQPAQEYQR